MERRRKQKGENWGCENEMGKKILIVETEEKHAPIWKIFLKTNVFLCSAVETHKRFQTENFCYKRFQTEPFGAEVNLSRQWVRLLGFGQNWVFPLEGGSLFQSWFGNCIILSPHTVLWKSKQYMCHKLVSNLSIEVPKAKQQRQE